MNTNLGWLASFCFVLFGAVFLKAAVDIGESFSGDDGHRILPLTLSALTLLCALVSLVFDVRGNSQERPDNQAVRPRALLTRVGPLMALMALNGLGQTWFGYLAATFVCAVIVFRLFGNSWRAALIHAAAGAIVLHALFFGVLGLYQPPGTILDLSLPF